MSARALVFDFNGTLSDDEPLLCRIYVEMLAERGRLLTAEDYFDRLAGLSDPEILHTLLGADGSDLDALVAERVARYETAAADGSTVPEPVRAAVRFAAERAPLAICSSAARSEIELVVAAAGLASCFGAIVSADDVAEPKPHPEGYLEALRLLGVEPAAAAAFEDTEAGVASARAAGLGVVYAVRTTLAPERLALADELVDRIDVDLVRRCLS